MLRYFGCFIWRQLTLNYHLRWLLRQGYITRDEKGGYWQTDKGREWAAREMEREQNVHSH